jgi:hypothetical protein
MSKFTVVTDEDAAAIVRLAAERDALRKERDEWREACLKHEEKAQAAERQREEEASKGS